MKHTLTTNKLYILSGPSCSGKSTLLKELKKQGLADDAVISSDKIRKDILGSSFMVDDYGIRESLYGWEIAQPGIWDIIKKNLSIRMQQKMVTFLDSTSLSDADRKEFVEIAYENGMAAEVLIFDVELDVLKQRIIKRKERFDIDVVQRQFENFEKESKYPSRIIKSDDKFLLIPDLLPTHKIDVIGDVHGLKKELLILLSKKGWTVDENGNLYHPDPERKLLFLGDIVDRGRESLEVLDLIQKWVGEGKAYFINGNHEHKLIVSLERKLKTDVVLNRSFSSAETFIDLLKKPIEKQESVYEFLKNQPHQLTMWFNSQTGMVTTNKDEADVKIGFVHADIGYYNPYNNPQSISLYGKNKLEEKIDTDALYDKGVKAGLNDHLIIRGHIPNTSNAKNVFSLDKRQAFEGEMMLLPLDEFMVNGVKQNRDFRKTFKESVVSYKTNFNYDKYLETDKKLFNELNKLVEQKLISRKENNGLYIYKYDNKIFFKKLWNQSPYLAKARGLVMDIAGNIVQHPFDKIFNYGEDKAAPTIDVNREVLAVEKLNGFLGCITKHPFKDELLITTTGSFTSDFVGYINELIDDKQRATLLNYLSKNNQTLMFEVIHPQDPHIVKYNKEDYGLWLIGAREKEENSPLFKEAQLDKIGETLSLPRPKHFSIKFGDVLTNLKQEDGIEGYMIRDVQSEEVLVKIKTTYYLVTKFFRDLTEKKVNMMFKNPEAFKEKGLDEEFYDLVDGIVKTTSLTSFLSLEKQERATKAREIIDSLREQEALEKSLSKESNSQVKAKI
jgi:predicted kinase